MSNMTIFKDILRAVQSLKDCTNFKMEYLGVRVNISGRNSPYVSHQDVEFSPVPYEDGTLLIQNNKFRLAVQPSKELGICSCGCEERIGMEIPTILLLPLLTQAREYLGYPYPRQPLVEVATTRRVLEGWEDWTPLFRKHKEDYLSEKFVEEDLSFSLLEGKNESGS